MSLSVRSPDELIAALPHLLGFKPEESMVLVPIRSDLPTARIDFPTTPADRELVWDSIRDAFTRYARPGSSVAILCLTEDRHSADLASQDLTAKLDTIGIDTRLRLWANRERWCDFDSGESGAQTEAARDRVAAETVLAGRAQPAASRESLAASLAGDRGPIAQILRAVREVTGASTPQGEGRWAVVRLQQFRDDGNRLSDHDAARMLLAMQSTPIRDRLWDDMNQETVASHVALWTDLTRRAPDHVRAAPASMLGFASWLNGDGAQAWCALDQVPEGGRRYPMADLVAAAVQGGVHPREWKNRKLISGQNEPELSKALSPQVPFTSHPTVDRPIPGM